MKLKVGATGMVLGIFVALMHLIWMVVIYVGVAQWYLDWIFGLHLLTNPYKVMPFNFTAAITLIIVTFVVGYLMGSIFAVIWNRLHKGN